MNTVAFTGHLTKDVECKTVTVGGESKKVANFVVALNEYKGKDNNDPDYVPCEVWGVTAEAMANKLKKGSHVGITGKLRSRSYEKDEKKIFVLEVLASKVDFL